MKDKQDIIIDSLNDVEWKLIVKRKDNYTGHTHIANIENGEWHTLCGRIIKPICTVRDFDNIFSALASCDYPLCKQCARNMFENPKRFKLNELYQKRTVIVGYHEY